MGRKRVDTGVLLGEKPAEMGEFPGRRQYKRKPGIYAVGSWKLRLIGIWGSKNAAGRIRRLRHDMKKGRKNGFLDEMGLRFASDVEFQLLTECREEEMQEKLVYWVKQARAKGYSVVNVDGDMSLLPRRDPGSWAPAGKLAEIMDRFSIGEPEMLGLLDTLERGIEHNRGRG